MHQIYVSKLLPSNFTTNYATTFSQCYVVTAAAIGTRTHLWSKLQTTRNIGILSSSGPYSALTLLGWHSQALRAIGFIHNCVFDGSLDSIG